MRQSQRVYCDKSTVRATVQTHLLHLWVNDWNTELKDKLQSLQNYSTILTGVASSLLGRFPESAEAAATHACRLRRHSKQRVTIIATVSKSVVCMISATGALYEFVHIFLHAHHVTPTVHMGLACS